MNSAQALAFVQQHGVVLVSAKGPVPRLTLAIAGEPMPADVLARAGSSAESEALAVFGAWLAKGKATAR